MPEAEIIPEEPKVQWYSLYLRPADPNVHSNTLTVEKSEAERLMTDIAYGRSLKFKTKDGKQWWFSPKYISVVNFIPITTAQARGY